MNKTKRFDRRLEKAGFSYVQRNAIKLISKGAGLRFTETGVVGDDIEGACLCKVEEIEV